jgi:hypothetical protein
MQEILPGVLLLNTIFNIPPDIIELVRPDCPLRLNYLFKIFNPDGRRCQASLQRQQKKYPSFYKFINMVEQQLLKELRSVNSNLCMKKPKVLQSFPGCAAQNPHTDMDPFQNKLLESKGVTAGGILFALNKETTLLVWPTPAKFFTSDESLHNVDIYPVTIKIPPGRSIYFRGDVIHAGAGYLKCNTRIHWYVDEIDTKIESRRYDLILKTWAKKKLVKLQNFKTLKLQSSKAPKLQSSEAPKLQNSKTPKLKTPKLQNSKTPKLRNSKTPKLQNSKTPKLQNSKTPKLKNSKTPKLKNSKTQKLKNSKTQKLKNSKLIN